MRGHEFTDDIVIVQNKDSLGILDQVHITQSISEEEVEYAPGIGFLAVERPGDGVCALGFIPFGTETEIEQPETIRPITELDKLLKWERTIDRLGKGVGDRFYNTPEATMAAHDRPQSIGAYLLTVSEARIWDTRSEADRTLPGKFLRVAEHAGRMIESIIRPDGLRKVTDRVHRSYGNADVVLVNQPPNAARRQHGRLRHREAPHIDPAFMIIRNPAFTPIKVGHVDDAFFAR